MADLSGVPQAAKSPSIADKLRAFAAQVYADPLNLKAWNDMPAQLREAAQSGRDAAHTALNYFPEPGIRDQAGDVVDLAFDTASSLPDPQKRAAQLAAIRNGVQQTATGFNEGLASTVGRALDTPGYFLGKAIGLNVPEEARYPFEGTFRKYFVDPAGPPMTPKQRILRAGGNVVGENIPTMFAGGGLAARGIRSGISLARQAAGGLVDGVVAPAAVPAVISAAEPPAASSIADRLRALAPTSLDDFNALVNPINIAGAAARGVKGVAQSAINTASTVPGMVQRAIPDATNALNPTNIINAVRPANLQGAANSTLDFMARNPVAATGAQTYRAFRQGERGERARQAQQPLRQANPNDISSVPLGYNYGQF